MESSTTSCNNADSSQNTSSSNTVDNAQGSSTPGCEPDCFTPSTIAVRVGESVTFANTDSSAHTSTSGTSASGPSGHWNSELIMMNSQYVTPELDQGTYHYFCMVHPWMEGKVIVGNGFPLRTAEPLVETIDIIPPTINASPTVRVSITNSTGATVNYNAATASDNKEITADPYCHPQSGSFFPVGTTKVTCSVTDSAGNTGTTTFDVKVINSLATGDTIAPTITQPNMITVDATTANGAIVEYKNPIATDDTAVTYGPVCTPKSGSFFEIGSNTVTCIAKDNAGNQGSVAFLLKVNSKIAIPEEVKTSVSVNVGKKQYQNDEAIFITGAANPISDEMVNLEIRDSLSNLVGIEQANIEKLGSYTAIVFPSQLWNVNGTYSMTSTYGSSKDVAEFDFLILPEAIQETPIAQAPTQLNIKQYLPGVFDAGETIEISADLNAGTGHSIILSLDGPGGQLLLQPLNTDSSGTVSLNYALSNELVTGTYTITAKSTGDRYDLSDSLDFTVIAPIPELEINEVKATTEDGVKATTYNAGELAYFSTDLTTKSTTPVLVTVNVFDAEGNTLGVGFFKSKIGEGDSEIVLGFELPEDVISGVAEVYTNVFTDWPDQGGVPITDEIKASVQLIGVEPEQVVAPTPTSVPMYFDGIGEFYNADAYYEDAHTSTPSLQRTALNSTGYSLSFHAGGFDGLLQDSEVLNNVSCTESTNNQTLSNKINQIFMGGLGQEGFYKTGDGWNHTFPVGTTTVTCTGTDSSGNVGTGSFTVTVLSAPSQTTSTEDVLPPLAPSGPGPIMFHMVDDLDFYVQRASVTEVNPQVVRTALNSTGYTLTVAVGDASSKGTIPNLSCTESNNGSSVSLPGLFICWKWPHRNDTANV